MCELLKIRKLLTKDIDKAMELVWAESWNQTCNDWNMFIEGALNICLAAEICGKLVATATAINYSNKVAWIGMVLVNKENRGKGISIVLLNALFKELKSCPSIKLDATPAGQHVYKKIGFVDEYLINRMVNISLNTELPKYKGQIAQKIQDSDIPAIIEFDKQVFGANRTQLISKLIRNSPDKSWVIKQNKTITGFVLGRKGNKYYQIGPLSAQSLSDVKILMSQVISSLKGQAVVLDVLDDKRKFNEWLTLIGFVKQRDFLRMYKGSNLYPGNNNAKYLISGPELG